MKPFIARLLIVIGVVLAVLSVAPEPKISDSDTPVHPRKPCPPCIKTWRDSGQFASLHW